MQLYDCPRCGALEPGVHRDTCSLAGLKVWQEYSPFDWSKAEALLKEKAGVWQHQWPERIVLINAESLNYKVVDTDREAFDPDNPPFGHAPATSLHLFVKRLDLPA